jgi:S1-C subfamily serine protease
MKRKYVLGCHGWWDKDGFNITMVPQGSALGRLRTTPGGGAPDYYLEPRDIIIEIENIPVTTPVAYFMALNTARNWRDVKLKVYDAHQNKQLILYATAIRLLGD